MSNVGPVSYYKVLKFSNGSTDFPLGISIDNINSNSCNRQQPFCRATSSIIQHGWGRLVTGGSVEIYPYDANGQYNTETIQVGGLRGSVSGFPVNQNNGRNSVDLGVVTLPKVGDRNVGKLNGFVQANGQMVAEGRVTIDVFQESGTLVTSTTGAKFYGFASDSTNYGGYYTTGPVPSGSYKIYVTDNRKESKRTISFHTNINLFGERLDFDLSAPSCFGRPSCVVEPN